MPHSAVQYTVLYRTVLCTERKAQLTERTHREELRELLQERLARQAGGGQVAAAIVHHVVRGEALQLTDEARQPALQVHNLRRARVPASHYRTQ